MKVHLCTCRDSTGLRRNNDHGMRALRAARVRLWRPCGAGGHRTRGRAPPTHRARRLQLIRTQNIPLSPFSRWVKPPHIKCRPLIVANRVMCCKKQAAERPSVRARARFVSQLKRTFHHPCGDERCGAVRCLPRPSMHLSKCCANRSAPIGTKQFGQTTVSAEEAFGRLP